MKQTRKPLCLNVERREDSGPRWDVFTRAGFSNSDLAALLPGARSGFIGLMTGFLAGVILPLFAEGRSLAAPTAYAFLHADLLTALLVGASSGGAIGGCIGALVGLRLPDAESQFQEEGEVQAHDVFHSKPSAFNRESEGQKISYLPAKQHSPLTGDQ